jgi:hypothetical protein
MKLFSVILFLFVSLHFFAQNACTKVYVKGSVKDTLQNQSFYNLMIVNKATGRGVFGQPDGTFQIYANQGDTLSLSVKNYGVFRFQVVGDSNCQMYLQQLMVSKVKMLTEVVIKPLKSVQQIKEERANLALKETHSVTGVDVLQSPITALYERFSKKAQQREKIEGLIYIDQQRKVLKELLRIYVAYEVIDLKDDEFDAFIIFLNINEDFLKTSSDMELINFIRGKFEHFPRKSDANH